MFFTSLWSLAPKLNPSEQGKITQYTLRQLRIISVKAEDVKGFYKKIRNAEIGISEFGIAGETSGEVEWDAA